MGSESLKATVVDAGPLIHLSEIGCVQHLRIFKTIHIPDAVWSETIEQARFWNLDISALGNIQRHTLPDEQIAQFIRNNGLEKLHAGEVECLYVCKETGVSVLLTDDLAVREAAKRMSLRPVGSLGIVVKACRAGDISLADAEGYITDLYDVSSLFVTRAIVEIAIEQLRNNPYLPI